MKKKKKFRFINLNFFLIKINIGFLFINTRVNQMPTFEFSNTCERVRHDRLIQQPFSFIINLLTIVIVSVMLLTNRIDWSLTLLMMTIILFESWHALCHARPHLLADEDRMVDITHSLYLFSMAALTCVVSTRTRHAFWLGLLALVLLDLYTWTNIRGVWMIFSGLLLAVYLICHLTHRGSPLFVAWILILFASACIMLYNEKKWCLLTKFPLHIITELILCLIIISTLNYLMQI